MYYKTRAYRIFNVVNIICLSLLAILCVLPLLNVLAISFSGKAAAEANLVGFWPKDFNLTGYKQTLANPQFLTSFWISIKRTVIGTVLSVLVTVLAAYPLSKPKNVFPERKYYTWFFVFMMLFGAGLVPTYLVIKSLGLIDSFWVLVLPGLVSTYNIILMMNFFQALPYELTEAAYLDGASEWGILFKIVIPISMPSIATIALFNLVGNWNAWFDGMLYMNKQSNWPLQTLLQTILVEDNMQNTNISPEVLNQLSNRSVKAAQIFITMLPILAIYPFLQKYFVKGVVLGAVKE